jgi:2'-hydroxyisoflavone reductase
MIAYDRADVESAVKTFAGNIDHYVLCSKGAVYRDYTDSRQYHPFTEEDADLGYKDDFAYSEGKRAVEMVLWSTSGTKIPFPFIIIRPAVVEGPEDPTGRTWFWVQRVSDGHEVLVPRTTPSTIFRHVHVDDVADVLVRTLCNPSAFNQAYNVAGGEVLSLEDYVLMRAGVMDQDVKMVITSLEKFDGNPDYPTLTTPSWVNASSWTYV